jgi:hypothetical protein
MERLTGILFIDIETVPIFGDFNILSANMQAEWVRKMKQIRNLPEGEPDPAALFSEFAKVVCIGFGSLFLHEDKWKMRLKSLVNSDEKVLLQDFCQMLTKFSSHYKDVRFCGHNIKEFDIPFLCRRMIINNMGLPQCMQVAGKKPWEVSHLDTMELWRFGDHKNFTPLSLLAEVLGIPSPKGDIDGSQVANVFWKDNDLKRIGHYCLRDVHTSAKVYLRLSGIHDIDPEPIFVND